MFCGIFVALEIIHDRQKRRSSAGEMEKSWSITALTVRLLPLRGFTSRPWEYEILRSFLTLVGEDRRHRHPEPRFKIRRRSHSVAWAGRS